MNQLKKTTTQKIFFTITSNNIAIVSACCDKSLRRKNMQQFVRIFCITSLSVLGYYLCALMLLLMLTIWVKIMDVDGDWEEVASDNSPILCWIQNRPAYLSVSVQNMIGLPFSLHKLKEGTIEWKTEKFLQYGTFVFLLRHWSHKLI